MGTLKQNYEQWAHYDWPQGGDEWSQAWGGSEYVWYGTILPRINSFLPTTRILESAPGFGRITNFIKEFCEELLIVDLVEKCIEACKKRFQGNSHIQYFVNDGRSLAMVPSGSIDFIFSWDSLVHAEKDVMQAYIHECRRILRPDGFGFIHHSNMGAYCNHKNEPVKNLHWRDESMSADLFKQFCKEADLQCVSQEIIGWGGEILNDCFSMFTNRKSESQSLNNRIENKNFMAEADRMLSISKIYNHRLSA